MYEKDYAFYYDQKGPRKMKSLDLVEPLTEKDAAFQRRYKPKQPSTSSGFGV